MQSYYTKQNVNPGESETVGNEETITDNIEYGPIASTSKASFHEIYERKHSEPVIIPGDDVPDIYKSKASQQQNKIENKMAIDLYYTPGSAPCRLVLLVAAALNIQLNHNLVNLRAGEQLQPDFLKLNPQHTVPTLVDDGFSLWESRAISRYLVNKYGGDSSLYPEEPKARALVDQRLDFDIATLYPRFAQYFYPQIFVGAPADEGLYKKLQEGLGFLNTFLDGEQYAAGSQLTLADLSLVATVSTIDAADINLEEYPNILRWFELVKATAPNYEEANGKGIQEFKAMVRNLKPKTEL